jgi:hypothetical protein
MPTPCGPPISSTARLSDTSSGSPSTFWTPPVRQCRGATPTRLLEYDPLVDTYVQNGWLPMPQTVSFTEHILPFLRRLSNLQWVSKGFAAIFGDAFGSSTETSPRNVLDLPAVQQVLLQHWADGDYVGDWEPGKTPPQSLDEVPLTAQPAMLDKAALHFCLADAFHPGCEMTWPLRHPSMFDKPFRFRLRPAGQPEPDYGDSLTPAVALAPGGPLYGQMSGSVTRWRRCRGRATPRSAAPDTRRALIRMCRPSGRRASPIRCLRKTITGSSWTRRSRATFGWRRCGPRPRPHPRPRRSSPAGKTRRIATPSRGCASGFAISRP